MASSTFFIIIIVFGIFSYKTVAKTCTVTSYDDVTSAVSQCTNIVIDGITVPGGDVLTLDLQTGTKVTFQGTIKFEYKEWTGHMVVVKGSGVTIEGAPGSVLDGQGALYWDGKGSSGITKPKFLQIETNGGSVFQNIKLLNCPKHCVSINGADTIFKGWTIDVSDGDSKGGHNTDGFDIESGFNILIEDSIVKNQDDCAVVNYGSNVTLSNLDCSGGHGLSLSVGMNKTDPSRNVVSDVTFKNCTVRSSANGIHVKTHSDGTTGYINDVTYEDIDMYDIVKYGINIQQDYENGRGTKNPTGNVPITNLSLINVRGTMGAEKSTSVYILCGEGGCSNWNWSNVSIVGGNERSCNFTPEGYTC